MTWLIRIILVFLPIVAGFFWLSARRKYAGDPAALRAREKRLALISGLALVGSIGVLLLLGPGNGERPDMVYIQTRFEDGKLIEGEWVTPEEFARRQTSAEAAPKAPKVKTFGDE